MTHVEHLEGRELQRFDAAARQLREVFVHGLGLGLGKGSVTEEDVAQVIGNWVLRTMIHGEQATDHGVPSAVIRGVLGALAFRRDNEAASCAAVAPESLCSRTTDQSCPVHGTCRCPALSRTGELACPLHSPTSEHAQSFRELFKAFVPCQACGWAKPWVPSVDEEAPIVRGALDEQANAERRLFTAQRMIERLAGQLRRVCRIRPRRFHHGRPAANRQAEGA